MNQSEFLTRTQDRYEKQYNRVQIEDIKVYLDGRGISNYKPLYDWLSMNNKFLPKLDTIKEYFDEKPFSDNPLDNDVYKQTPDGVLQEFKSNDTGWIVDQCRKIRALYDTDPRTVSSKRISFLTVWEPLTRVKKDDWETVKRYIIMKDDISLASFMDSAIEKINFNEIGIDQKFPTRRGK